MYTKCVYLNFYSKKSIQKFISNNNKYIDKKIIIINDYLILFLMF
jgi:hypothetical protein